MQKSDLRVFPRANGTWAMQREGATRASATYDTKRAALDAGRRKATRDGVDLTIQNRRGWTFDSVIYSLEEFAHSQSADNLTARQRPGTA